MLRHNPMSKKALFIFICFAMLSAQPSVDIPAKATTTPTGFDVDDCAIWVHPSDPSKSLVIINDKGPITDKGGLYIYDLGGAQVQKVPVYKPQNPDVRYGVVFGKDTMDVLVCVDREIGGTTYNKVRVYRIHPEKSQAASGFLEEITTSAGIPTGQSEAYGHGLYLRPSDGALFSIVSPNSKNDFTQIKLESDGAGKVKGSIVRRWGADDIQGDICEGICCDDELGFIYICDENARVLKYRADPDEHNDLLAGAFAQRDGVESDREGINIYRCADTTGYILLSSQGNDRIKVYDRATNAFKGTLVPAGMKDCDGLDVTAVPLGPQFPHGMAAFHLGSTVGSQYSFYDWSDIATGLALAKPCDAPRSRNSLPSSIHLHTGSSLHDLGKSPCVYYLPNKIRIRNLSSVGETVKITLYGLQGQLRGTLYEGATRLGEITIPLKSGFLRPGTYVVKYASLTKTLVGQLAVGK
jgi:3-phytase